MKFYFVLFFLIGIILSADNSPAQDLLEKGLSFAQASQYDKAIEAFTKIIEKNPDHAEALNYRGAAWYHKGDYEKAISDYTKSLQVNPRNADVYNNRGSALYQKGDYNQAIADYTMALRGAELDLELDLSDSKQKKVRSQSLAYADVYNNRGAAWYNKGLYDKAIADYSTAIRINPGHVKAITNMGIAWFHKGECGIAIESFRKALKLDTHNADALNQLAWTLAVCPDDEYRDGNEALALAKNASDLYPGLNYLDTLAAAYAEAGDFDQAVRVQTKVLVMKNNARTQEEIPEVVERLRFYKKGRPWRFEPKKKKHLITALPRTNRVDVGIGNIRIRPTLDAPILSKVLRNNTISLILKEGEWYLVRLSDNRTGWAHESLFPKEGASSELPPGIEKNEKPGINGDRLEHIKGSLIRISLKVPVGRVREAPSLDSRIKYRLRQGDEATVIESQGDWYAIKPNGHESGWAHRSLFNELK
jgi:tetratricopeptide (TPR) repeat protein